MFTYSIILAAVLIISPFVLKLATSQRRETKQRLKFVLLSILSTQILLGFLNWENFTVGRSGFELAFIYPSSLLGMFFITSILQVIFLAIGKSFNTLVVVSNFVNSVLIFMGMIRLSGILGFQPISLPSIGAVFLVLIGNIIALAYINKDDSIFKKYPFLGS